ncbi:MAG TPA: type II toxin-antitoxin system PemK/MazF family toxin [Planctomycetaceae bacterium]|nr:type II toxin-antitoxin system PemK/MazF family toxin [Planctomycetaceae bacterium]
MRRGEVWWCNLDPTVGAEQKKQRPGIIVNDDAVGVLPLKVIVPLTDWKDHYSVAAWMVRIDPTPINGLQKSSAADCFQVRSVSQQRLSQRVGRITDAQMEQIGTSLKTVLHLT